MLPKRIPKEPKRSTRWRSPAHCNFVRSHACCVCGSTTAIEVAHVRMGSGAGMGQKPDDWNTLSLCKICHAIQHRHGEQTFWNSAKIDPHALAEEFSKASPKSSEIRKVKAERGDG